MSQAHNLREASPSDIPEIVALINRAFSVERFFKSGDRVDAAEVEQLMREGKFLLLHESGALLACMFVRLSGERGYVGTLSVSPDRQRSGVGSWMMGEAETYCRAAGCTVLDLRIVDVRPELREIYHKLGFVETGTQSAAKITTATRPVQFITMSKKL